MDQSTTNKKVDGNSTSAEEEEQPPPYSEVSYEPPAHRVTPSPILTTPQYRGLPTFNMDDMIIQLSFLSDERNKNSVEQSPLFIPSEMSKHETSYSSSHNLADSGRQQGGRDTDDLGCSSQTTLRENLEIVTSKSDNTSHGRSLKRSIQNNDDHENIKMKTPRHDGRTDPIGIKVLKANQNENKEHKDEKDEEMMEADSSVRDD